MLLVLEVKGLENLNLEDMESGKKVKVEGIVQGMYFDENYIKQLEDKAIKYDDFLEAKEKSIEILKDFSKLGFLGHNIKPRESF